MRLVVCTPTAHNGLTAGGGYLAPPPPGVACGLGLGRTITPFFLAYCASKTIGRDVTSFKVCNWYNFHENSILHIIMMSAPLPYAPLLPPTPTYPYPPPPYAPLLPPTLTHLLLMHPYSHLLPPTLTHLLLMHPTMQELESNTDLDK